MVAYGVSPAVDAVRLDAEEGAVQGDLAAEEAQVHRVAAEPGPAEDGGEAALAGQRDQPGDRCGGGLVDACGEFAQGRCLEQGLEGEFRAVLPVDPVDEGDRDE